MSGVVVDGARPTAVKTRVVAEGLLVYPQQVARLDRVDRTPLPGSVEREVIAAIERAVAGKVAAVLVSDYQGGMTTPKVLAAVRAAHTRAFIAADAQVDPARFAGFDLIRCNEAEAERALGIPVTAEAVTSARARLGCRILAVTRGPETALLAHPDGLETAPAANRTDVYDVTGAGDAVAAVLTTALALEATPAAALTLAQLAGGISVRKWGNVPVTAEELEAAADAWDRRAG